jgi:hypothetical protein
MKVAVAIRAGGVKGGLSLIALNPSTRAAGINKNAAISG